jgi:hypothetical protein
MIKKLVENQSGKITIDSEIDKSTKFEILLLNKKNRLKFDRYKMS